MSALQRKSGIYKIVNLVNNKEYVGSSYDVKGRVIQHFSDLRKKKHCNKKLQNAFNKYGELSFQSLAIEYCSVKDLLTREQYYIDTLSPFYNACKIAGRTSGLEAHNRREVIKADKEGNILSVHSCLQSAADEIEAKVANIWKVCTKKSLSCFGFIYVYRSEVTREELKSGRLKRRVIKKTRSRAVVQLDKDNNIIHTFPSVREAINSTGITTICLALKNESYTGGGYKWRYN